MYLDVLVVVRLGRGSLATNVARERPFAGVYPLVFGKVVLPVELPAANLAGVVLVRFMLAGMSDPVVFADELAPAVVARVRSYGFVSIHVSDVVCLPDKPTRTHVALERFQRRIGVRPSVLLQVPVGAENLIAYRTGESHPLVGVRFHVTLHAGLNVRLIANCAHFGCRFKLHILFRMGQADVSGQTVLVNELFPTEGTAFWLVFVNLPVPLHFGLRLENLSAITDKIFLARNLVQVMSISVLSQVRESPEVLIAVGTLDRCLPGVNSHVLYELLLDDKLLPTKPTLVIFDTQVPLDVQGKVWPMFKASPTGITLGRMRHKMGIEQFEPIEFLLTRTANICTFPTYLPTTTTTTTRHNSIGWSSHFSTF